MLRALLPILLWLVFSHAAMARGHYGCAHFSTVPMATEQNSPLVTLAFKRPDGGLQRARFVFDSGGGALIFDASLAADIGLHSEGKPIESQGQSYTRTTVPEAFIGSLPVTLRNTRAYIHVGKRSFDTRESVAGLLPGKALEQYEVVLNYSKRLFTIAPPGCLGHRGKRISTPFVAASGHPMIEVSIAGKRYNFLLDTGSTMTLARRSLLERLAAEHPDWPHSIGAVGAADMPGSTGRELLVRVPDVQMAGLHIRNVVIVSRPDSIYAPDHYETPAPIVGALGENVLSNFRVQIDYPDQATYLEKSRRSHSQNMETVGLTLQVNSAGKPVIVAIASDASKQTRQNLHPGDVILKIDGAAPAVWTLAAASHALAGKPGEEKHFLLLRNGARISTIATVVKIL